jgi:hypothetical protein
MNTTSDRVMNDVRLEREAQDAKWGQQNHPDVDPVLTNRVGGCSPTRMAEEYEMPTANRARFLCKLDSARGHDSWARIALEEFAEAVEAFTLGDTSHGRVELIQTAAVLHAWVEAIDRRQS